MLYMQPSLFLLSLPPSLLSSLAPSLIYFFIFYSWKTATDNVSRIKETRFKLDID